MFQSLSISEAVDEQTETTIFAIKASLSNKANVFNDN